MDISEMDSMIESLHLHDQPGHQSRKACFDCLDDSSVEIIFKKLHTSSPEDRAALIGLRTCSKRYAKAANHVLCIVNWWAPELASAKRFLCKLSSIQEVTITATQDFGFSQSLDYLSLLPHCLLGRLSLAGLDNHGPRRGTQKPKHDDRTVLELSSLPFSLRSKLAHLSISDTHLMVTQSNHLSNLPAPTGPVRPSTFLSSNLPLLKLLELRNITPELSKSDLSHFTDLTSFTCCESLDHPALVLKGWHALEHLDCSNSHLRRLNISDCVALQTLECASNSPNLVIVRTKT